MNNKLIVGRIFCDLKRVFSCADYGVLFCELKFCWINGKDLEFYQCYLYIRYFRTAIYDSDDSYELRIKQATRCIKFPKFYYAIILYTFRQSVPIIRSYLLYTRQLVRFMQVMWPLPSRDRLELSSNLSRNVGNQSPDFEAWLPERGRLLISEQVVLEWSLNFPLQSKTVPKFLSPCYFKLKLSF